MPLEFLAWNSLPLDFPRITVIIMIIIIITVIEMTSNNSSNIIIWLK